VTLVVARPGGLTAAARRAAAIGTDLTCRTEQSVITTTLDRYAGQSGVARFALVKIDAEGHDLAVLRGARGLLAEHRITVAQFEYHRRWILARSFRVTRSNSCCRSATGSASSPRGGWSSIPAGTRTWRRSSKATTWPASRMRSRDYPR
jgi:methyltransferase FkbM-like protein